MKKPTTMKAYLKSKQDRVEDKRNAKKAGEPVSVFKKTAKAKAIDRKTVAANKRSAKK